MIVKSLDTSWLFNQIRAYNQNQESIATQVGIVIEVGIYTGLIDQEDFLPGTDARLGCLTSEKYQLIMFFLCEFCRWERLNVRFSEDKIHFLEPTVETKL